MALQHVLDTARKLGIPVVITDEAGEAAQVVMPFDDFAAMVGATAPAPRRTNRPRVSPAEVSPSVSPIPDDIERAMAGLRQDRVTEPSLPVDEAFLEEKFYLEPVDDEVGDSR